jgi:hypothetical protein
METRFNGPQIAIFFDFENVATSAEANFGTFDVTTVMELLRSRGRLLVKRAYADWGRFQRYRRPMLEKALTVPAYPSASSRRTADVRLAIDAEVVHAPTYIMVVSGSDFTELIHVAYYGNNHGTAVSHRDLPPRR